MNTTVKFIHFEVCAQVWATKLWPGRTQIESASAMMYSPETEEFKYDMRNMDLPRTFIGLFEGDKIIGVNSGHACADKSYRSRGLWVDPVYRGRGLGVKLLAATIVQAMQYNSTFIWSYPRLTSKKTYENAGFTISSGWKASETSDSNAYCIRHL